MARRSDTPSHPTVSRAGLPPVWSLPLPPVALVCAIYVVCTVLDIQAHTALWGTHLSPDLGEYAIRAHKYLEGRLTGSEYPPLAVLFFLVPTFLERFGMSFVSTIQTLDMMLIGLHMAILDQVQGRASSLLFGVLMLAAGPIVLFRFELLVSLLVLMTWWAWTRQRPRLAGALLALAALTKLYPIVLAPLLLRTPTPDRRWQPLPVAIGFAAAGFVVLMLYGLNGDPLSIFRDVASFHQAKPVALESVTAAAAITGTVMVTGQPPRSVNEYGIHGLPLPGWLRLIPLAGLLVTWGWIFVRARDGTFPDESARFVLAGQGVLLAVVFWSTLFQPQYLLWPLALTALVPACGGRPRRLLAYAAAYATVLLTEQVIYPCQYTRFLDWFYRGTPGGDLLLALIVGKVALTALFCLALTDLGLRLARRNAPTPRTSAEARSPA